jgi:hypothetical protein
MDREKMMTLIVNTLLDSFSDIKSHYDQDSSKQLEQIEKMVISNFRTRFIPPNTSFSNQIQSTTEKPRQRCKSGYSLYMSECFQKSKDNTKDNNGGGNSQESMANFSRGWSSLSKEEQNVYKQRANEINQQKPVENVVECRTVKRMTGYNLFYKENVAQVQQELSGHKNIKPMVEIGSRWKALPLEQRELYNQRAAEIVNSKKLAFL